MLVTLKVFTDIYSKPKTEKDRPKLLKRNVIYLKQFDSEAILPEQYLNAKGIISKKWCLIREGEVYFKVNHRFEDIVKITSPKPLCIKGFGK